MTQEIANQIFETDLGQQLLSVYSTSDGRAFIRFEEAQSHAEGKHDTDPDFDLEIKEWFPEY